MPDPIARKRLKKRMLDRWENEGGSIAADTTTSNDTRATSEDKRRAKKPSSLNDNATAGGLASPTKRRKPGRK